MRVYKNLFGTDGEDKIHPDEIAISKDILLSMATMESWGNKTDGYWFRWGSGLQVCFLFIERKNVNMTTKYGSIYTESSNQTWYFPKPFAEIPSVFASGDSQSPFVHVRGFNSNGESATYRAGRATSSTQDIRVSLLAIGRWK